MVGSVFPHKTLVKFSMEFVPVMAHRTTDHKSGDYIVNGKKKHMCGIYDLDDCKQHEAMSAELAKKSLAKGVRGTPTHIIYNPHNFEELGRAHHMTASQIEDQVKAAQKKLGKPIAWKDFSKMKSTLDDAQTKFEAKDYRGALKALKGYKSKGMKSLDTRAKTMMDEIMAAGQALIDEAKKCLEAGDKMTAQKHLRDVTKGFSGTDLQKKAQELLKECKEE